MAHHYSTYRVVDAVPEEHSSSATSIPYTHRHRRYGSSPYLSPTPTPYLPPSPTPSPPANVSWSRFHHQHSHYTPQQQHLPQPISPPRQHHPHSQQHHGQHRYPSALPTLRSPRCSICSSPRSSSCNCEFTSLVITTEDAESAILTPLLDEIRRVVTTRAKRHIQRQYHARVEQAWAALQSRTGGRGYAAMGEMLQEDADRLWRECVQNYPTVLEEEYRRVEEGMRMGRGWRGEEEEVGDEEDMGIAERRHATRRVRSGKLRVYTS